MTDLNLYISGTGNDALDGSSQANAVQSYARVKALVQAAKASPGYTAGVAIIVNQCGGSYTLDHNVSLWGLQFIGVDGGASPDRPVIYQGLGAGSVHNPSTVGAGSSGGAITTLLGVNGLSVCLRADHVTGQPGASYLILRDFDISGGVNQSAESDGSGTRVRFDRITARGKGISAAGINCGITNSDVSGTGIGLAYGTGSTPLMVMSDCYAINNDVHDIVAQEGILCMGPGCWVVNNKIRNCSQAAILYADIYHQIAFNEIFDVLTATNDFGAIYGGRSWYRRGTRIYFNYIHGLHRSGNYAIYLDDQMSGEDVYGNIVLLDDPAATGVGGYLVGGGSDNVLHNNVFASRNAGNTPFYYDDRGAPGGWEVNTITPELVAQLKNGDVPYQNAQWTAAFPKLSTILTANPNPAGIPARNIYRYNVSVGAFSDLDRYNTLSYKTWSSWVPEWADQAPILLDPAAWTEVGPRPSRLGFDPASAAFSHGFKALELTSMGLYPAVVQSYYQQMIYQPGR